MSGVITVWQTEITYLSFLRNAHHKKHDIWHQLQISLTCATSIGNVFMWYFCLNYIMNDHEVWYLLSYQLSTGIFFYKNKNHLECACSHIMPLKTKNCTRFFPLALNDSKDNLTELVSASFTGQSFSEWKWWSCVQKQILINL